MIARFYDSAWQHPGIAWLGALALVVWLARSDVRGALRVYLMVAGAETALDALCTGALSPLPASAASTVGITFVILGDARLFALVERTVGRGWLWRAVPLAFVVPVLQVTAIQLWPARFAEQRWVFLVYEALFVLLGSAYRWRLLPGRLRGASEETRRWALGAVTFFLAQYALWVIADALILAGQEWALLLRVVPNALYYAGFVLFVGVRAPPGVRRAW